MPRLAVACLLTLLTVTALPPRAAGCTVCDGGTGQRVRAGILDGDLARNLAATLLPFGVMLGVVAVIHFGGPRRHAPPAPQPDRPDHGD